MIQYENAAGPADWIADALTMKSTTATKITTMSKEPRTRGSMPGAMRSEAITRSFAAVAMPLPPYERTPIGDIVCLGADECKRAGLRRAGDRYAGQGSSA